MGSGERSSDRYEAVPSLASDCDPTKLTLTPAEGFLLSRIDGQTSWRLLREIGGLPPDGVDECLERWLADGLLEFGGMPEDQAVPTRPAPAPPRVESSEPRASTGPPVAGVPDGFDTDIDESLLDASLDLDEGVQRRILVYEANLARPAHELLGLEADADPRRIKKAYFKLSKEFHPDRHFRRNVGPYGERLHRVFKKILEAYEALSDPAAARGSSGSGEPGAGEAPGDDRVERLRQRMPFQRISEEARAENRRRAEELYKAAEMSRRLGNVAEAENSAKVGLSFDPNHAELRTLALELRRDLLERQLADARERGSPRAALEAARALLEIDPDDPERRLVTAELSLEGDDPDPDEARRLAEQAGAELGETARICVLLARVHLEKSEPGHALRQAQRALELDPNDAAARELIASTSKRRLRRGRPGGVS